MFGKKAQSAMEYLMTYGWAILIVLIALAALFYLGVFSPSTPNICTVSAPFTCVDVKYDDIANSLTLQLGTSGLGSAGYNPTGAVAFNLDPVIKVNNNFVTCTAGVGGSSDGDTDVTPNPPWESWDGSGALLANSGQLVLFKCVSATGLTSLSGEKFVGTGTFNYTLTGAGVVHPIKISFSGKVE